MPTNISKTFIVISRAVCW